MAASISQVSDAAYSAVSIVTFAVRAGIHPDAARWLIDHRPVRAVGIDSMSVDYGMTPVGRFETHQILAAANKPILESLRLLTRLPARGATVVALPMKIEGGSGGPVRVVAFGWTGDQDPCRRDVPFTNAASSHFGLSFILFLSSAVALLLARKGNDDPSCLA